MQLIYNQSVVFLSGPVSGIKNRNKPAFDRMERMIREKYQPAGVYNPTDMPTGHSHEDYMAVCLENIAISDVVVFLPGWQNSPGAKLEFATAYHLNKELLFAEQIEILNGKDEE